VKIWLKIALNAAKLSKFETVIRNLVAQKDRVNRFTLSFKAGVILRMHIIGYVVFNTQPHTQLLSEYANRGQRFQIRRHNLPLRTCAVSTNAFSVVSHGK